MGKGRGWESKTRWGGNLMVEGNTRWVGCPLRWVLGRPLNWGGRPSRWVSRPSRWVCRPWQGARVARRAQEWLPATWLGSAWNDQDHSLHGNTRVLLSFTLVRGEGGVLEGKLGASCKQMVLKKKFLKLFLNLTFYIQLCSLFSALSF